MRHHIRNADRPKVLLTVPWEHIGQDMIDRAAEQISRLLSVTVAETGGFVNHHFQYSERCCIYFAEIVFVSDIIRCSQLM